MTAKELAEGLLKYPDFEVKFHFSNGNDSDSWNDIEIVDIGHSDKVIVLSGNIE